MEMEVPRHDSDIFASALRGLSRANLRFVVAGAFCMHYYTGFWRYTKDMDLFTLPEIVPHALAELNRLGFKTWIEADHWLGKATKGSCIVDLIFGSGNWLAPIDAVWFDRAKKARLFDEPVLMSPIEEMIWAKSYIAGRERYDGSDVCHLISACHGQLDWRHLVERYGRHWQLLLSYLNLYSFVYPADQRDIPDWLFQELFERRNAERKLPTHEKVCRGTLLDRFLYNFDVEKRGYLDAREEFALRHGGTTGDVAVEREWAREKMARGEVYKQSD